MASFRQGKRRTARFMRTLLDQTCCLYLTVKMQTAVADAVPPACNQFTALLPDQARLSIDETGCHGTDRRSGKIVVAG